MISRPNARREFSQHAPLPAPLNPYHACMHNDPYCIECVPEGTLLLSNHDTESRSWWNGAARNENATFNAFFLLGVIGLALSVHAKQHDNPAQYSPNHLSSAATRG